MAVPWSLRRHCARCDISVEAPDPRLFTFTSAAGWCPDCQGTGVEPEQKAEKPKKRKRLTVAQKFAIAMKTNPVTGEARDDEDEVRRFNKKQYETVLPEGYVFGRPSKYRKEYCQELIEHMSRGFSYETFRPSGGYACNKTLDNWCAEHPDFLQAKQEAFRCCREWWENQSHRGMFHPNFKTAAWRMNMMNRFGWSEKSTVETDSKRDLAKKFENMTDEELEKALDSSGDKSE